MLMLLVLIHDDIGDGSDWKGIFRKVEGLEESRACEC